MSKCQNTFGRPPLNPQHRPPELLFCLYLYYIAVPRFLLKYLLPQRFVLPSFWEAHSGYVNSGKVGKKCLYFGLHVIVGGNDVEEILDNAKVEIDAERIRWQGYPTACHAVGKHWSDSILFVPYAGMVTA